MAARTSWEGYLKLNLLSIPVKAYSATVSGEGKVAFHMIHAECNSRIQYKKFCPVHGEVPNDEIVSGYEYDKGRYLIVDPDELDKLLPANDKAIDIDLFIKPEDLDPIYHAGKAYYLVPDGRVAEKPYAVLERVMQEEDRYAVAKVMISTREHVVLVRASQGLLTMMILYYDKQVKKASMFQDDVPDVSFANEELKLAKTLVEASTTDHFDFSRYKDEYTDKVTKLLEDKAAGKKIVPARGHEEPVVINLMDALRKSLASAKQGAASKNGHPNGKATSNGKEKTKKGGTARKTKRTAHNRKTG